MHCQNGALSEMILYNIYCLCRETENKTKILHQKSTTNNIFDNDEDCITIVGTSVIYPGKS